jgi:CBS domain-containing protein
MPYQVKNLLEDRGLPVSVHLDEPISVALAQMIEHDYSQLPVVDSNNFPLGMVTYESILRTIRNFDIGLDDIFVRDAIVSARVHNLEDDLFDLLDQLKMTNAVLIIDPYGYLVGIVTSYDSTEYFRRRAENLMRVEDIEFTIKDFIRVAYSNENGEVDESYLDEVAAKAAKPDNRPGAPPKKFDDLSLGEYINMLTNKDAWITLGPLLKIPRRNLMALLNDVRETRNALAHFQKEITREQQDQLKFCADWLARHFEDFQEERKKLGIEELFTMRPVEIHNTTKVGIDDQANVDLPTPTTPGASDTGTLASGESKESRYAPLADWLQSQPGNIDRVQLTFDEIEELIGGSLPPSARNHRAWWANDSVGHPHSQMWLEAGWRRVALNLAEERVTFARMREREEAYIRFFSALLTELRKKADFSIKDISPDGASWMEFQGLPKKGPQCAWLNFSFSRNNRFRVELYIDTNNQATTKQIFDHLYSQRETVEKELGALNWERINKKRASRIAKYCDGAITDNEETLADLRMWAVDTMIDFYKVLAQLAEKAIREIQHGA